MRNDRRRERHRLARALRERAAASVGMLAFLAIAALAADVDERTTIDSLDLLWPSPLLKLIDATARDNNAALRKLILRLARRERGVQKTNLGGWQSDVDFFERDEPAVVLLRTRAYHAVFRYLQSMAPPGAEGKYEVSIGSAWANVNNASHSNSPHGHPGCHLAGVYYVDDGGSREGGIRLIDPRPQASMVPTPSRWAMGMGEHVRVLAVPGLFVLFPAWLQHYVPGHVGSKSRVSVSFNVRLTFPTGMDGASEMTYLPAAQPPDTSAAPADAAASGEGSSAAPKLSFVVPPHHQKAFMDASLRKDMRIS